ncbi:TetR/AcrR family transcriptional regulator [Allorhodopirellula heiligendammensis]|uniref:HTH-type transcriptional repressor ComR n=1 Tax=Allorhodopirellula heiligendammensis TaxID=2714739 RepID=A0A5C6BVS2_9BACT|nr:TetR/AcrR family transcriptional regulator [Allorhodopirellula heiligendammensis]TWU15521.1 HTH-type transcriptional repressor ComR [Allorhodopirellula heiligendammensis]
MPWEKSFDESDVIERAMEVFWEKGYAATSISDITSATGIKRGSLYNAFDGKHDIFIRALQKYGDERRTSKLQILETVDDPCEAIALFFDFTVESTLNDPERKGCLLFNTALDYSLHDDDVKRVVSDGIQEVVTFFERQITRGKERGDIPDTVEVRPTAKALVALVVGIRVLGRGAIEKTALRQISCQAIRLIS